MKKYICFFLLTILSFNIHYCHALKGAGEACTNHGQNDPTCASGRCGTQGQCTVILGEPCASVGGAPTCYAGNLVVCAGYNGTAGSGRCIAKPGLSCSNNNQCLSNICNTNNKCT